VEEHETLETSAVIRELADAVKHKIDDLLADSVVATSVVVCGVLLARDNLLGVVQLTVGTSADFVTHTGLQVDQHGTGHVLASTSLREKGVERVIAASDSLVGGHLAVRLDAVLEAVKLPARVTGLDTGLAKMDGKALSHVEVEKRLEDWGK